MHALKSIDDIEDQADLILGEVHRISLGPRT